MVLRLCNLFSYYNCGTKSLYVYKIPAVQPVRPLSFFCRLHKPYRVAVGSVGSSNGQVASLPPRKNHSIILVMAVKVWALGHLLINGDLASIILFGSFLVFAILAMISANRRAEWKKPEEKSIFLDILVILIGGAVYVGVGMHHLQLFGVAIM